MKRTRAGVVTVGIFVVSAFIAPTTAQAGCGCDHPPPVPGAVYPRFAAPDTPVSVDTAGIDPANSCVRIDNKHAERLAVLGPHSVKVKVPKGGKEGPQSLKIFSGNCATLPSDAIPDAELPDSAFTKMYDALPVVEAEGTFFYDDVPAAVAADGTLLLPFDITNVVAPMQFYITILDLPLRFDEEGLTYYNKDEYNLKLFEQLVSGPEGYQWGAYYGSKVVHGPKPANHSDTVEYWRHEFESYALAHLPGGSHEVLADGLHPDGTPHVDHYGLVLALDGMKSKKGGDPYDPKRWTALRPGVIEVSVAIGQLLTEDPVALADLSDEQQDRINGTAYQVRVNNGHVQELKKISRKLYK